MAEENARSADEANLGSDSPPPLPFADPQGAPDLPYVTPALDSTDGGLTPGATQPVAATWSEANSAQAGRPGSALSIVAFSLAVVALGTAFLGVFAFVSWLFGLPAFIVGIVALVKKARKGGLAIAAVIVSAIAFITSIVVFVVAAVVTADRVTRSVWDELENYPGYEEPLPGTDELADGDYLPLTISEATFWHSERWEEWTYIITVTNENSDVMWERARFDVEAFDADGVLLDANRELASLPPGETAVLHGRFRGLEGIMLASIEVREDNTATSAADLELGEFLTVAPDVKQEDHGAVVSGNVQSTFREDQEVVKVVVVARDTEGTPVGVGSDRISRVPAGGVARYELNLWGVVFEEGMTLEVYPHY